MLLTEYSKNSVTIFVDPLREMALLVRVAWVVMVVGGVVGRWVVGGWVGAMTTLSKLSERLHKVNKHAPAAGEILAGAFPA